VSDNGVPPNTSLQRTRSALLARCARLRLWRAAELTVRYVAEGTR